MKRWTVIAIAMILAGLPRGFAKSEEPENGTAVLPGKRSVIGFAESPIQSSDPDQIRFRLMAEEEPPAYDVSKESFEILLPPTWKEDQSYGLFIWINAGDSPAIPKEWEAILAKHDLIFIGAKNSGNKRNIFDRIRLAIDANHNVRQKYRIDGRRVYVSGFSGGSRVASMLGVAWGDMFSGAICCMGVNFYKDILAPDGKVYGLNYIPSEELLPVVKQACRYSLITGEKDFNLANTKGVYEKGFKEEGFQNVQLLEVSRQGHQPPPAAWLEKAIQFLDEGKK